MSNERHAPLISCESLLEGLDHKDWVVFDCRHDLSDIQAGPTAYAAAHVPGAFHAHIDHDLSDPVGDGTLGRHPLPDPERFTAWLSAHGVKPGAQVVVYDEGPGAWAARLWWLLRHYGHEHVAVLDGGLARWEALGLPMTAAASVPESATFEGKPGHMPTVDTAAVEAGLSGLLVDARAPERYSGEVEPIDPVAGHVPGAVNRPFAANIGDDGLFLSPDELNARYEDAVGGAVYCGSGVTAAHVVLAMAVGDLAPPALYPGSWSAWCSAPRPVVTGDAP